MSRTVEFTFNVIAANQTQYKWFPKVQLDLASSTVAERRRAIPGPVTGSIQAVRARETIPTGSPRTGGTIAVKVIRDLMEDASAAPDERVVYASATVTPTPAQDTLAIDDKFDPENFYDGFWVELVATGYSGGGSADAVFIVSIDVNPDSDRVRG